MHKILITDYAWHDLDIEREVLAAVDGELIVAEIGDEPELIALAPQADAILFCWQQVTRAVLDAAPDCKIASRFGVGLDNIALDYATELGIPVAYVPDYCMDEVADHTLALLLACARSIFTFDRHMQRGEWNLQAGRPMYRLRGRTVGLVGLGRIGQMVATKARAFGFRVIAYDPFVDAGEHEGVTVTHDPDELLGKADYVCLHVPLNEKTTGLVDVDFLRKMKPEAYLINTSRGGLVDESALYDALVNGQIAGAALDVMVSEPAPADDPLRTLDNVLITPHAAFDSVESLVELRRRAAEHVVQALNGELPKILANSDVVKRANLRMAGV